MTRAPGAPLSLSSAALVASAQETITTLDQQDVLAMLEDPTVQIVDIRDIRELERDGMIPGARHAPRGMLEFWIDPESPYHKPVFAQDKTFVFFCAGGWRSALSAATAQDMGLTPVAHVEGGFTAWKKAGGPIEASDPKD